MRTIALLSALLFAAACGHNKSASSSTAQGSTAAPKTADKAGARDKDDKVDEAAKGHDKDGDHDDGDDEGPAKK